MRPDDEAPSSRASRLANAASFSFTSPVHSFRSRRNAVRSRELSRICAWRFTDIRDCRDAGTARRLAARKSVCETMGEVNTERKAT